jgi:hypothetical protein
MARHRLFDARHSRKSYARVGPTGVLYRVFCAHVWIMPPADIASIPTLLVDHAHPPV